MMSYRTIVADVLNKAESAIRASIRDAADHAEYEAVSDLVNVARALERLRLDMDGMPLPEAARLSESPATRLKPQPRQRQRQTYPRFVRGDDTLIKIGWSKSNKSEYEHRAPKSVLDSLVAELDKRSGRAGLFATDKVFPLSDASGSVVPDYQSYLCLAWLCSIGVVDREGRRGYRIVRRPISATVAESWKALKERE